MSDHSVAEVERKIHETRGAVDILDILREEMEQWLEEAQDASKHEALENVLGHIGALDVEYKRRFTELEKQLEGAS